MVFVRRCSLTEKKGFVRAPLFSSGLFGDGFNQIAGTAHGLLTTVYNWLILVFGEALKTTDLSAMLLQHRFAGGGKQCRRRPCFPYQKDWK